MSALAGTAAKDTLTGTAGADTLTGGPGNDTLVGLGGIDVAVFSGSKADYTFATQDGQVVVIGPDGTDTLTGINVLRFDDGDVGLSFAGANGLANTTTAGDQYSPATVRLAEGSVVLAWTSGATGIHAQRYSAEGAPLGGEILLGDGGTAAAHAPALAALPDGGFLMSWSHWGGFDSRDEIHAQRFNSAGQPVGSTLMINVTTAQEQQSPSITPLTGGGFVVAWQSTGQDGSQGGIYGRVYNADAQPLGGEFRVNTTTDGDQAVPTVAGLKGGGFVVTWISREADGDRINAQRYDAAGVAVGAEFRVDTPAATHLDNPTLLTLADGGFLAMWCSDFDIRAQRYDAAGATSGSEFTLNTYSHAFVSRPCAVELSDGGFVVTWDGTWDATYVRTYDANGIALAAEVEVGSDKAAFSHDAVVALGDNQFLVAWTKQTDGSDTKIGVQICDVGGPLTGALVLTGGTGADILTATAGASTLLGGAGNDTLTGGAGSQTLDGGSGDDTLIGGLGCDTYLVDSAADVIIENSAAGGTDFVRSSVSWTLGANIEDLELTDFGDLVGTGNSLDNVLMSNFGHSTLIGGGGNDLLISNWASATLIGGEGDDRLFGSGMADLLDGGGGRDILQGGDGDDVYLLTDPQVNIIEGSGAGTDTVESAVTMVLQRNLENLVLTGTDALVGVGNKRDNVLTGNGANNFLLGKRGNDTLFGGDGKDCLSGGEDDDTLVGGAGADTLTGGSGIDVFRYDNTSEGGDRITDFECGRDKIVVYSPNFGALAEGALSGSAFVVNGPATDAIATFLYNTATQALSFDADGTGAGAAITIATFDGRTPLSASDILVTTTTPG